MKMIRFLILKSTEEALAPPADPTGKSGHCTSVLDSFPNKYLQSLFRLWFDLDLHIDSVLWRIVHHFSLTMSDLRVYIDV